MKQPLTWFDAHLDLAYMAVAGRDMTVEPRVAGGPDLPGAITLKSLEAGEVRYCLATVFTEPDGADASYGYPAGDCEAAARVGRAQMAVYERWVTEGRLAIGEGGKGPLRAWILVEGADPIREPEELEEWVRRGVAAIGLTWAKPSRYAGGNMTNTGLTELGREMVVEMDRLGVLHDLSHLSDKGTDELLSMSKARVIASHSNCRSLINDGSAGGPVGSTTATAVGVPPFQRHLRDEVIREVARRGGVVGINLYSAFLIRGGVRDRRASIDEVVGHVERVCELTGSRRHVGLGSDMDGGFSALTLPRGVDEPRDLGLIATALEGAGWSDEEIRGFASENWLRILRERGGANVV